jgi:hypothetical protein
LGLDPVSQSGDPNRIGHNTLNNAAMGKVIIGGALFGFKSFFVTRKDLSKAIP